MNTAAIFLAAAIELSGLSGGDHKVRAYFDANNVKVGDPLTLTVDFLGEAEFSDLHPPALSKVVDRRDWKVDDIGAKTDTFKNARRLTYRVRPMRKGLLRFPALEFAYRGEGGERLIVKANSIPVHAKGGVQVAVEGMDGISPDFPKPPRLRFDTPEECAGDDEIFAWRRACASPTADGFAVFSSPAAKMNEASCAIKEGNWARALKVYRRLEWVVGQNPEMEKGIVAALALKYDNPKAELPVWRVVLRPLLRYSWVGRVVFLVLALAAMYLVVFLLKRGITAVACLAFIAVSPAVEAGHFFQSFFGTPMHRREEPVKVSASLECSEESPAVGDDFEFILSLEFPRNCSIGQVGISPSNGFGLRYTGKVGNLTDGKSSNPSNIVRRLSVPVRYDVPFKGRISFIVEGMVSGSVAHRRAGGYFSSTFSNSFRVETGALAMQVRPLPSANRPDDFGGIVSEGLEVIEKCDIVKVETNDVVVITYTVKPNGYVPDDFLPAGVDFEWQRRRDSSGALHDIQYRRFFVADGVATTPELSIAYYDPGEKKFKRAKSGSTRLEYHAASEEKDK